MIPSPSVGTIVDMSTLFFAEYVEKYAKVSPIELEEITVRKGPTPTMTFTFTAKIDKYRPVDKRRHVSHMVGVFQIEKEPDHDALAKKIVDEVCQSFLTMV